MSTRVLQIRKGVLNKNDELARALRERLHAAGLLTLNLVSSPGAGKTRFLELTLRTMRERGLRPVALVGDLATDNDATRLAQSGAPVRQITTHSRCHLEAEMVAGRLDGWSLSEYDYLFIENVGNLVCPASYDLGEDIRVALLSVTEGEDKPLKYPDSVQLSGHRRDYEDGPCRSVRIRSCGGASQPAVDSPGNLHFRDLGEDRRWACGVDRFLDYGTGSAPRGGQLCRGLKPVSNLVPRQSRRRRKRWMPNSRVSRPKWPNFAA